MTCLKLKLPLRGARLAELSLPQLLTPQALLALEHAVQRSDGAETEYVSWMPDAGAIEFASWTAHMLVSRR